MSLAFEEFQERVAAVGCAGGAEHGPILYGLVRWLKPRRVVEVGTCHGYSACWLGRGLEDNGGGELVCIDDYSYLPSDLMAVSRNLGAMHLDNVTIVLSIGKSTEVEWPPEVDLAYIDGNHSWEGCSADVNRAIAAGAACVVVHDTVAWWGPRDWAADFRHRDSWDLVEVPFAGGLGIAMKTPEKPPASYTEAEHPLGAL